MVSLLGHHVNRRIFVSLPELLGSSDPLTCVLISCEAAGIWVSSPDLAQRLCPPELAGNPPPIFIPYSRIGFAATAELHEPPAVKETPPPAPEQEAAKPQRHHPKRR